MSLLGGPFGDELGGGASGDERLALLDNVKLKLAGGGGLSAAPLHQSSVAGYRRHSPVGDIVQSMVSGDIAI